ncbi:hypothetical protein HNP47_000210 [Brevundimonas vesicularis]|uniref:ThuA-like domain-containing protein n=1 Tax=Brevundimonas vesicularis TaxID=41276 RepID=A0A7W9FRN8_BREVE|nr:hypothetical protein [Brevundimonas vesicularis]MBB5770241.1 hypothetical protein [Brevundimonas vesicularis]
MAAHQVRILLQTTITASPDDWSIGRFGLLADLLRSQVTSDDEPAFHVTARDRSTMDVADPILSTLDDQPFDQLWLFGVDAGGGLKPEDLAGIDRFRARGGGLLVTRDHMDLGASVGAISGVGAAHNFHSLNPEELEDRRQRDDPFTTHISWPNYHSGPNGDFQVIEATAPIHPLLAWGGERPLTRLPAHPHEGAVSLPRGADGQVVAQGVSQATDARFNIAVALEGNDGAGRAVAQSTFHHFVDYNWDPLSGCPGFVDEPPGDTMATDPDALKDTHRYVVNLALWLAGTTAPKVLRHA